MLSRLVVRRNIKGSDASRTYDLFYDDNRDEGVVVIQWVFNLMLELRLGQRDDCTFLYGVGKDEDDPRLPRQEGPRQVFYLSQNGTDVLEMALEQVRGLKKSLTDTPWLNHKYNWS